jgi:hypothetical protein
VVRAGREVARFDGLITDRDLTAAFDREAGGARKTWLDLTLRGKV